MTNIYIINICGTVYTLDIRYINCDFHVIIFSIGLKILLYMYPQKQTEVYLIHAQNNTYKIGYGNPRNRLRAFQTGNHQKLDLLKRCPGGRALEKSFHEKYQEFRIRGEWFSLDPHQVDEIMDEMGKISCTNNPVSGNVAAVSTIEYRSVDYPDIILTRENVDKFVRGEISWLEEYGTDQYKYFICYLWLYCTPLSPFWNNIISNNHQGIYDYLYEIAKNQYETTGLIDYDFILENLLDISQNPMKYNAKSFNIYHGLFSGVLSAAKNYNRCIFIVLTSHKVYKYNRPIFDNLLAYGDLESTISLLVPFENLDHKFLINNLRLLNIPKLDVYVEFVEYISNIPIEPILNNNDIMSFMDYAISYTRDLYSREFCKLLISEFILYSNMLYAFIRPNVNKCFQEIVEFVDEQFMGENFTPGVIIQSFIFSTIESVIDFSKGNI